MNSYKLEFVKRIRYLLMLWETPVYRFRVPEDEESEYLNEVVIDVTGSAFNLIDVKDTMRGVWEKLLDEKGKEIKTILDFGAGKFRNTLYFLNKEKKITAVEFEDLSKKSNDAKEMLKKCEKKVTSKI